MVMKKERQDMPAALSTPNLQRLLYYQPFVWVMVYPFSL